MEGLHVKDNRHPNALCTTGETTALPPPRQKLEPANVFIM